MRGHGDPAMLRKISSSSTQTTGATGPGETITEVSRPIRGRHCVTWPHSDQWQETSQTSDTSSQARANLMEHDQRQGM